MDIAPDYYLRRSAEIVAECAEYDQEIARIHAKKAVLLAERAGLLLDAITPGAAGYEQAERSMFCEVAAGLRVTQYAAVKLLTHSRTLHERLPATRAAFEAGKISVAHMDVIVEASYMIPSDDTAAFTAFEAMVVPYACGTTRARTKVFAESAAARVAPVAVTEQHRHAHQARDVTVTDDGTGLSTLHVTGPSGLIHAAHDLLTQEARATLKNAKRQDIPDGRTLGQVRFDRILLRTLTGLIPDDADILTNIRATVQVTIAATTLTGHDNRMGELDGHGPLDPDLARLFAETADSWERLFLNPDGMVTHTSSYKPPEGMKRYLRARDQTCRFPGCRQPARRCHIDHNHDHALGGPTDIGNLSCFCATHHALKHPNLDPRSRWTARQAPGGVITWTTPSGIDFTDTPPPRVMFMNDDLHTLAA